MSRGVEAYLAASLDRQADLEDLVRRLFRRLEIQQILTQSAVLELAAVAAPKGMTKQQFVNKWYRDHRVEEMFLDGA